MKASEILVGLAELLGGLDAGSDNKQPSVIVINNTPPAAPPIQAQQPAPGSSSIAGTLTPVAAVNTDDSHKTTMVPPLQQKIELLKKSLNIDNEFNHGFDQIDQQQDSEDPTDELDRMKKMAGITRIAQQELASDEPLDI